MKMRQFLPIEIFLCFTIWTTSVFYSIYKFSKSSNEYFHHYSHEDIDFVSGWKILSRKKDETDFEWYVMKIVLYKILLWSIPYLIVLEILKFYHYFQLLIYWQIILPTIYCLYEFGIKSYILLLLQPIIFTIIAKNCKNILLIWVCNGFIMYMLWFYKEIFSIPQFVNFLQIEQYQSVMLLYAHYWMYLKCISYIFDHNEFNFVKFLSYCLHFPTLICGPIILYNNFKKCQQIHNLNLLERLTTLLINLIRFILWLTFTEVCLHYIYLNATAFYPKWVETLDTWSLYGYGYLMGQFFHLKYLISYGVSITISQFENIETPKIPRCIGGIHLYSDMWKFFDEGLHKFLVKYIYKPSLDSNYLFHSKLLGRLLCFYFIYVWHGIEDYIFIWVIFNYLGLCFEDLGNYISKILIKNKLSSLWIRRIGCVFGSILLSMSAISNFYFFARTSIGNIFIKRLFNGIFLENLILFFILYCCCQFSAELRTKNKIKIKNN